MGPHNAVTIVHNEDNSNQKVQDLYQDYTSAGSFLNSLIPTRFNYISHSLIKSHFQITCADSSIHETLLENVLEPRSQVKSLGAASDRN